MTRKIKVAAYWSSLLILTAALGLIVLTSCGGGNGIINPLTGLPAPSTVNNTVPVTVGITPSGGYPNGVFISVTVCGPEILPVGQNPQGGPPPAPTCQTIPNILVDTGSVGLRLLDISAVDVLNLPVVTDSNGHIMQECVQFADFSYVWGSVARATIQMAGETAAQVPLPNETANTGIPIQIIGTQFTTSTVNPSILPVPADCLSSPPAGGVPIAANTLQTLGANGILGVGSFPQDCGGPCTSSPPRNQYYFCPSNQCSVASVPLDLQLWNPVAAFAYDNNGLLLTLPFPDGGASGPITGSLNFGNGTQSNNALGTANILAIDAYGNFPEVTLTEPSEINPNILYTFFASFLSPQNGSYLDTGSPAIYFADAQSLAIPECPNLSILGQPLGLYCPATETYFQATMHGTNNAQGNFSWNVDSAATLLNSNNSVFTNLGGESGIGLATDYVDLGVPFFLGRSVFLGFAGTATLNLEQQVVTYPNGYWAF